MFDQSLLHLFDIKYRSVAVPFIHLFFSALASSFLLLQSDNHFICQKYLFPNTNSRWKLPNWSILFFSGHLGTHLFHPQNEPYCYWKYPGFLVASRFSVNWTVSGFVCFDVLRLSIYTLVENIVAEFLFSFWDQAVIGNVIKVEYFQLWVRNVWSVCSIMHLVALCSWSVADILCLSFGLVLLPDSDWPVGRIFPWLQSKT